MVVIKTTSKSSTNFRQLGQDLQREVLRKMVGVAIDNSPVDTAAYVDSFGFNSSQGYDSRERPRTRPGPSTNVNAAKSQNLARLQAEVDTLDLSGPVVFGNSAPHAKIVESKHVPVFSIMRREFGNACRQALAKVKQEQ